MSNNFTAFERDEYLRSTDEISSLDQPELMASFAIVPCEVIVKRAGRVLRFVEDRFTIESSVSFVQAYELVKP